MVQVQVQNQIQDQIQDPDRAVLDPSISDLIYITLFLVKRPYEPF